LNLHQEDTIETATGETATGETAALDAVKEVEDIEPEEENTNEEAEGNRMPRRTMISVSQMMTSSSTARVLTMQQDIKGNIERHGRPSSLSKATSRYATAPLMGKLYGLL